MLAFLNDLLWSRILIVVLIGLGLWFTVGSKLVQVRMFGRMFSILTRAFRREPGHVSSFQALALSVAGRVGAGNIAGVAVAVTLGGAGAIFWMWVVGLVGMATSFLECTLAQAYKRSQPDGSYRGGPAYYIERGLRMKWLAITFSVLLLVTFGFGFNALQSYTVASSFGDAFTIPEWTTGLGLVLVLGLIIFGGVRRIAEAAEVIVPFMAVLYILMAVWVIGTNITAVPEAISLIVGSALGFEQVVGGGVGAAIVYGVQRGLFSNEAGLGSAPNVAAIAHVRHPVNQGIVQSLSVFIDTLVICTCTAMVILLSGIYTPGDSDVEGVPLTQSAMADHVGEWGRSFVALALLLFAFTSMMYNYYLGETSLGYLTGENRIFLNGFRALTLVLIFWGSVQNLGTVFGFADVSMGLLALANLFALALLFKIGRRILADYDQQLQDGVEHPTFDVRAFEDLDLDPLAWPHEPVKARAD